jgi:protein-tyrosine phosphatase
MASGRHYAANRENPNGGFDEFIRHRSRYSAGFDGYNASSAGVNMSYIATYGSKRGMLEYYKARATMLLGGFASCTDIDFTRVNRLVFVCKGNICRSAYADAFGRQLGLVCDSAGIDASPGALANDRVAALAANRALDLNQHRTRRLDQQRFSRSDLLIGMEPWHLPPMRAAANEAQVTLLGLWHPPYRPYLHDPFGAPQPYLETCIDYIEQSVQQFARYVAQPLRTQAV